jgi:hypothetical protein
MLSRPSKLLIILLALLQLIAPLVHAHTHDEGLKQGVHLPELEIFTHHYNIISLDQSQPHSHDCSIIDLKQGIKKSYKTVSPPILFLSFFLLIAKDDCPSHYDSIFGHPPPSRISLIQLFPTRAPPSTMH